MKCMTLLFASSLLVLGCAGQHSTSSIQTEDAAPAERTLFHLSPTPDPVTAKDGDEYRVLEFGTTQAGDNTLHWVHLRSLIYPKAETPSECVSPKTFDLRTHCNITYWLFDPITDSCGTKIIKGSAGDQGSGPYILTIVDYQMTTCKTDHPSDLVVTEEFVKAKSVTVYYGTRSLVK